MATTHKESKKILLEESGADEILLDDGNLSEKVADVTKVLELVGATTLKDSLLCVKKGGIICQTGILGGIFALNGFDAIKDIPNGVYLTGFHSNFPTQKDVDDIFVFMKQHKLLPRIGKVYGFSQIKEASEALDYGRVNGKIVVNIED